MDPAFHLGHMFREEILMRLPITSLIPCRCVCRSWNSLFFDPYFSRSYFNRSISQNPNQKEYLILLKTYKGLLSPCFVSILSRTSNNNLPETRLNNVPSPLSSHVNKICLVGSINGLVCLASRNDLDCCFVLWNPVIHQSKTIIIPGQCNRLTTYMFGFGWDSLKDDYKLIAVSQSVGSSLQAIVYSCKTDSWSNNVSVDNLSRFYIYKHYCPLAIVKGIPYWKFRWSSGCVIKFDVTSNEFSVLEIFRSLAGGDPVNIYGIYGNLSLINMNDHLALIEYGVWSSDVYRFNEEGKVLSRMYTICKPCLKNKNTTPYYGGEILYNGKNNLYDPKTNEIRTLAYSKRRYSAVQGFSYTPSLLSLEGMSTIHP